MLRSCSKRVVVFGSNADGYPDFILYNYHAGPRGHQLIALQPAIAAIPALTQHADKLKEALTLENYDIVSRQWHPDIEHTYELKNITSLSADEVRGNTNAERLISEGYTPILLEDNEGDVTPAFSTRIPAHSDF